MPPTVVSAVDSQKTWFRSPLMTFHQNFIPRRRPTTLSGMSSANAAGTLSLPINSHQHQQSSTFNDNPKPRTTLITNDAGNMTTYSKLATDKEGVPLFCTKSFLSEKQHQQMEGVPLICAKSYLPEKQRMRAIVHHDHRNCWPSSKNYRCFGGNDNSSSCARNRDHDASGFSSSSSSSSSATPPLQPPPPLPSQTNKPNLTISEECYLNSENCLPRIIKPRKRRKKDRKPSAATIMVNASTTNNVSSSLTVNRHPPSNGMSATTDAGWCYNDEERQQQLQACRDIHKPLLSSKNVLVGMRVVALCRPNSRTKSSSPNAAVPFETRSSSSSAAAASCDDSSMISRSLINILSENNGQSAGTTIDEIYGGGEDDEDDDALGGTSVCRCKYCDPESVVWDVSQRCFSPNLMPPVGKTFGQTSSVSPETSPASSSKLNYTTLKRSSSEPTSKPFTNPVVARVRSFSGSCDKGSQNLLVSSQIVTSHDGHRDIEVKFFSMSTSSSSSSSSS